MTKKIYRIELKERDSIFTDMVLDAALSNGGNYVPLNEIAATANYLCRKYPATGSMHTVNLIGNSLTIDKGTENIVTITEVEVMELDMPQITSQEAKDILSGVPTIDRYLNPQGLADNSNHELLN